MSILNKIEQYLKESVDATGLKHSGDPDSDFDAEQLKMGIEVEKEHSDDIAIRTAIAKAHLAEFPDYYTALKKMEDGLKKAINEGSYDDIHTTIDDKEWLKQGEIIQLGIHGEYDYYVVKKSFRWSELKKKILTTGGADIDGCVDVLFDFGYLTSITSDIVVSDRTIYDYVYSEED